MKARPSTLWGPRNSRWYPPANLPLDRPVLGTRCVTPSDTQEQPSLAPSTEASPSGKEWATIEPHCWELHSQFPSVRRGHEKYQGPEPPYRWNPVRSG